MERSKRGLTVIKGEAMAPRFAVRREFVVVEQRPLRAEQMTFASWAASSCKERLLSVGFDSLDFAAFRRLLIDTGVRYVFDVRNLASFRGRGFSPALTEATFRELGVAYERCLDLANEYVGTSRNQQFILHQYATRLRAERSTTLDHIVECAQRAPLLLLGREPAHFGTEREILVELLAERHLPLEVVVAAERSPAWRWTSIVLGDPAAKRGDDAPGRASRGKRTPPKQLTLLERTAPKK